jgi:hypothetical protein
MHLIIAPESVYEMDGKLSSTSSCICRSSIENDQHCTFVLSSILGFVVCEICCYAQQKRPELGLESRTAASTEAQCSHGCDAEDRRFLEFCRLMPQVDLLTLDYGVPCGRDGRHLNPPAAGYLIPFWQYYSTRVIYHMQSRVRQRRLAARMESPRIIL